MSLMRAACVLKDRLLKLVCISFPESGQDPARYPNFSRLENAVDVRCCHRMFHVLFKIYLRELGGRYSREGAVGLRHNR